VYPQFLTEYQAFRVRQWDQINKDNIRKQIAANTRNLKKQITIQKKRLCITQQKPLKTTKKNGTRSRKNY